jgi:acyl-CoA dehydrogenase
VLTLALVLVAFAIALAFTYAGLAWWGWMAASALVLADWLAHGGTWGFAVAFAIWAAIALATGVPAIRRRAITRPALGMLKQMLPKMSETERVALEAGTTWWDAELFSGAPDFSRILQFDPTPLSPDERAFLDGPCTELCRLLDDHAIRAAGDLPLAAWSFIKRERFMGMIIPTELGGLGFSARAHSAVVAMLASRSAAAAVTVMVPNSLGPAELLLRYGTDEQKARYLPRLATGDEVPCFALTEPHAGSDAASIRSKGVICRGTWQGKVVTGIRLEWDKRYITLAPVATVLGLAFHLYDPERLLGDDVDRGITCALIPTTTPGVWIGRRHDPLSVPFQNGPTRGHDVFVPIDHVIGGHAMVGQGWRMLMECLSAGRSLSLPADAVGSAQLAARYIGAYATLREQFGLSIGAFEGVAAPLGRIAGTTYWMNAVREVTAGAVDAGERPGVISAITKCWETEALRRIANDAMDVAGGAGICKGARNVLAPIHEGVPIGITVEGANILTRSLIVFGQGAIRCHPWALHEMQTAQADDVDGLDAALAGHANFALRNAARAFLLGLTGGTIAGVPGSGRAGAALRELSQLSAAFATITDAAMLTMGGKLKRAEALAGRMADALAWMYIASATVNRYAAAGYTDDDVLFDWAIAEASHQARAALSAALENLPNRVVAAALRFVVFPLGARVRPPRDRLTLAAGRTLVDGNPARLRLTRDMFVPPPHERGLGRLEHALDHAIAVAPLRKKLRHAQREMTLAVLGETEYEQIGHAVAAGVLTGDEASRMRDAIDIREDVLHVDDFSAEHYTRDRSRRDEVAERDPERGREADADHGQASPPH